MTKIKKQSYRLEDFNAGHFFAELVERDGYYCKSFFGGLSIYVFGKMVAFLCDRPGQKTYRGKRYKIDLWNGCLIPSHRDDHDSLLKILKGTTVHPVIEKWLYLPYDSKYFEQSIGALVDMIEKKDNLVGVPIVIKPARKRKR